MGGTEFISRILKLKTVIGILTPIVAILMAFVVSGLIILIFITYVPEMTLFLPNLVFK